MCIRDRFDTTLNTIPDRPRSMYNDSYEAYGANWTTDFREEFRKRRGYDLIEQLTLLQDTSAKVPAQLVRIDYLQTLAELLRERYTQPWTLWSKKHGYETRYQAHGSPGNLLDLYDDASIPETESFGTSRFPIPGLRIDPDHSTQQFGPPNPMAMKFASVSYTHLPRRSRQCRPRRSGTFYGYRSRKWYRGTHRHRDQKRSRRAGIHPFFFGKTVLRDGHAAGRLLRNPLREGDSGDLGLALWITRKKSMESYPSTCLLYTSRCV